jgi:rhodanese-related sulfurtransferase
MDRNVPYFVYCRSGHRSAAAVSVMQQLGFQSIYELDGGISAWQAAGLPTS